MTRIIVTAKNSDRVIITAKGADSESADQSQKEIIRERMKNSKYNRKGFPDWLNLKSDDELDRYFDAHPSSEFNPASDPKTEEQRKKRKEQDEQHDKHTLPLVKRLTFKGWVKSAPTKEVRKRLRDMKEMKDDLILDKEDVSERLDDLREAQKEDRDLRGDIESPRRKKRLDTKIARRANKIDILRNKLGKLKARIAKSKKRIDMLHKEMRNRT